MLVRLISKSLATAIVLGALSVVSSAFAGDKHNCLHCQQQQNCNTPQCREYQYGNPDLFYNFYVPPNCGGVGAELYPAPFPVPAHVGHTYYTYQPLMPHEMLYKHHRSYHRYYNEGRGLTRTSVHWR